MDISALQRAGVIAYSVGQPYNPDMPLPIPETPHLRITGSHVELVISYHNPSPHEVDQFTHGLVRFGWVDSEQVGVFAFKLGDIPWADCPFHPQLVVDAGMDRPRLEPGVGKVLVMIFVDGLTGRVAAIRLLGLPAKFVTAMAGSIERMLANGYDIKAHDAALDALYDRYPTSARLVRDRADVTCIGAQPDSTLPGTGEDAN